MLPVQMLAVPLRLKVARRIPRFYHRVCCRLLGFQVRTHGQISDDHPVLFVANHASYLDIVILGSLIPGSFIAKSEVATWPYIGLLAKLQRSVFIERRGSKAADHRDEIGARLESGDDLILFPEGTSNDGNRVLPFKSALFSVAERRVHGRPIVVQPVSIAYTHIDGLPIGREWRPHFAWYGAMELGSHLLTLIALGKLTVQVVFHPPFSMADVAPAGVTASGQRKAMADRCYAAVTDGVGQLLFANGRQAVSVVAKAPEPAVAVGEAPLAARAGVPSRG